MGEECVLIVAQSVLIDRHGLFMFKFDALHHSPMCELSARLEVFKHQSAAQKSQGASTGTMDERRDILDLAFQSAVLIDIEVVAYDLGQVLL